MNPVFTSLAVVLRNPAPWWIPYQQIAHGVLDAETPAVADALERVRDGDPAIPRFIEHSVLPPDESYEGFIARTRCVPTRDNLHDLLNGIVWLAYPQTKRRLNELQSQAILANGISGRRGPLRDALTLFDENCALLCAPSDLAEALRARDWHRLFVANRHRWQSTQLVIFGHALLEKLMQPRKGITAHVWLVESLADEAIAASLTVERLQAKAFAPLPVLGVPGWWDENSDPVFYEDAEVFRPRREK